MDNLPSICFFCRLTYPNFAFGGGELQKLSFLQCFLLRGFCRKKPFFYILTSQTIVVNTHF